MSRITEICS